MGEYQIYFKHPNVEYVRYTFFGRVLIRRLQDSYLWFDHKTNMGRHNALLNNISEKESLENATK